MSEPEKLWRVWWLWGIPMAWATSVLLILGETAHGAGHAGWGNLCDLLRLLVYWSWLRLAWKRSANVENRLWTPVAKLILAAGLVVNALV
jgi:hypothetical protein